MKLLLTSGGITNDTLARELEQLAGKPFAELKIGFIPSAAFGISNGDKTWFINDLHRLVERGATVAIISLADLTPAEVETQLMSVDVVLIGGGQAFYLSWLMQQKGLFELLPKLLQTKVYMGISAGSMIATKSLATVSYAIQAGELRDDLGPEGRSSAKTLGYVPFLVRPHLNYHLIDEIKNGALERIATETGKTIYAIDDDCAVRFIDGEVDIVGDGERKIIR